MLMNDFKKGSEPQYAAGKQVKKGADLTGGLVVGTDLRCPTWVSS
jgi:hypothetical protein